MDASEIYSKRLNAKEVMFPKEGQFNLPIADGRIKTPWRRSVEESYPAPHIHEQKTTSNYI